MSLTWRGGPESVPVPPSGFGILRAVARGVPLVLLLLAGLGVKLILRPVEHLLCHPRRPVTPWITVLVCRCALCLIGLRVRVVGDPMCSPGAVVANHSSWLDILVLNSRQMVVFVSKEEVAGWPGIGWLAHATGTLFIRREARREAAGQAREVAERLRAGQTLLFFPEGTSTDGAQVLPFRATLFAGLLEPALPAEISVQPVTVTYEAPKGEDTRFYAWFGDMELFPHALAVLAARRSGGVTVTYHAPVLVAGRDRKSLAREAEAAVRSAL